MSEHMKCSASPIVCVWLTSIHSSWPAVPLRLASKMRFPAGDHQRVEHAFFSRVLMSEIRPLYLEPIV